MAVPRLRNVLITGGAGYVGTRLTPQLLEAGWNVTVYDSMFFGCELKPQPRLKLVEGDIRSRADLDHAFAGADYVLHQAALPSVVRAQTEPAGMMPAALLEETARIAGPNAGDMLADTVRKRLDATWGLGETGATGPTGNRYGDKAGHTCIAVTGPRFARAVTLETGSPDRIGNMRAFGVRALELLAEALGDLGAGDGVDAVAAAHLRLNGGEGWSKLAPEGKAGLVPDPQVRGQIEIGRAHV